MKLILGPAYFLSPLEMYPASSSERKGLSVRVDKRLSDRGLSAIGLMGKRCLCLLPAKVDVVESELDCSSVFVLFASSSFPDASSLNTSLSSLLPNVCPFRYRHLLIEILSDIRLIWLSHCVNVHLERCPNRPSSPLRRRLQTQ